MNKKGVTLVELLGALAIFGLVMGLMASFLSLINGATDRINTTTRANTEGLLIIKTLETRMRNFTATDYSDCGTDCVTMEQHFDYVIVGDDLVLDVFASPSTLEIGIAANQLLIDSIPYVPQGFTINDGSTLTVFESNSLVTILIVIVLESDDGQLFSFTATHSFTLQAIPA